MRPDVVEMAQENLERARTVLHQAHQTAGLAAYQYFFLDASPASKATYVRAIEAESEAEALVERLGGKND